MDPNRLCMGCMRELPQEGDCCPFCGFSESEYERTRNTSALPVKTILEGKYLVGKVLGEGGFGITYIAWNLSLDMKVAIKEYFPAGLTSRNTTGPGRGPQSISVQVSGGNSLRQFQAGMEGLATEAKTLARFQEMPGVVPVYDYFMENNTAYLVMGFVEGRNLRDDVKKRGRLYSESEIKEIMRPVIKSLGEIHKSGIVHRDISPDNILIKEDGTATLIDFGAARMTLRDMTKSMTILLKHGFAPPEQYSTKGRQGPWTDVYALCATMMNLITGKIPDAAMDRAMAGEQAAAQQIREILQQAGISSGMTEALVKGMSVEIEKRCQNMTELYQLLYGAEAAPGAQPSRPREPSASASAPREKKPVQEKTAAPPASDGKKRTVLIAAAALALTAGVFAAAKLGGGSRPVSKTSGTEAGTETETSAAAGTKSKGKTGASAESAGQKRTDTAADAGSKSETETAAETESGKKTDTADRPESENATDATAETESGNGTDAAAETERKSGMGTTAATGRRSGTDGASDTERGNGSKTESDTEKASDPETESATPEEEARETLTTALRSVSSWSDDQIDVLMNSSDISDAWVSRNWYEVKDYLGAFQEVKSVEIIDDGDESSIVGTVTYENVDDVRVVHTVDAFTGETYITWDVEVPETETGTKAGTGAGAEAEDGSDGILSVDQRITAALSDSESFGTLGLYVVDPIYVYDAWADSTLDQQEVYSNNRSSDAYFAFDDNIETSWQEGADGPGTGQTLYAELTEAVPVRGLSLRLGNWRDQSYHEGNNRPKTLTITVGDCVNTVTFPDEWREFYVVLSGAVETDSISVRIDDVYEGSKWDDTVIADIGIYTESASFSPDIWTSWISLPADAYEFGGHSYYIYDTKNMPIDTYDEIKEFCEEQGGHLAVINSQEENDAIYQYVRANGTTAFFGYSDENSEGNWEWASGTSDYENWAEGQPNNGANNKTEKNEDYAQFFTKTEDGTWNDVIFGSNTSKFICEWDFVQ